MSIVYVNPTGSGDQSGSSAVNAKPVSALDSAIQQAGAGGTVNLLADKGAYNLSGSVIVSHGGTSAAPVTIQGVSSTGAAMDIIINGTRDATWTPGEADGNTIFKLYAGANNLVFQNMDFKNVGMAFQLAGNLSNVTFQHMTADNVRYFTGTYPGGGSTTADVTGLTVSDVDVNGFSKSVVILKGNYSNVLIDNVHGDSQYQDGDNFAMGVSLQGTGHDIIVRNSSMDNSIGAGATGDYTNGDGFTAEREVHNVQFINCSASGNGDGGFDLKSSQTTLTNCYAEDNKRNYRIWGTDVTIKDCVGVDPHKHLANASGTQANIWVDSDAHNVQVIGGRYVDSGSATDVVHSDGGDIRFSGTTIWHASTGQVQTGSGISGIDPSLVHSVAATGTYSTNGEQYLGGSTVSPPSDPTPTDKILMGTNAGDTLSPGTADHWKVSGLGGDDKITTLGGNDTIDGGTGRDTVNAGNGNDFIIGGGGADKLTGSAGNDTFVFKAVADSAKGASDVITDFTHGADKMDLSAIDANTKLTGNNAFSFLNEAAFTGHAGELRVDHSDPAKTVALGDVNGDKVGDFSIILTGHIDLTGTDFFL